MRFRILGPLEVRDRNGVQVAVHAPKQRALLTVLLLHAGWPVSADRLEAALWAGRPPRSSAGIIRTYVSGLRRVLDLGGPGELPRLTTEPGGYRLLLGPRDLDLTVFDNLGSRGREAFDHGDAAQSARLLSEALALWRGEPASDVTLDPGSSAVVAGLAERLLATEEAWATAQLALGGGADLIGRLRSLAAGQPLRESIRGQLMLALYRAGRTAEALQEFRDLRGRMVSELGIEPSAPVQELHRQLLDADPALGAPILAAPAPRAVPWQLPPGTDDFTGRAAQLDRLAASSSAIAIITGTAGAGKTALAAHFGHLVADRFPDGQLFADLRGYSDAEPMQASEALRRFLHALGAKDVPGDADEAAALYRSLLAGKRMLILLDNAATASQVRPLLPGAPGCLVLVTSRSRLPGLLARGGAALVSAGPLTTAEGVTLLRKILGHHRVNAEPDAATAIVTRCACLPLALRVAAERAAHRPQLALAELAAELAAEQRRLDVLTEGADGDATVRSVLSWSYHALPASAARMFRLLGLHPGPDIGVPAAAVLAATPVADAAGLLQTLAEVHLVEETEANRYRFHDLLRAYASERAAADESAANRIAALRRVLTWYLYTADTADRALMPTRRHVPLGRPPAGCEPLAFTGYPEALAWCDSEHPNLVAVVLAAAAGGEDDIAWKLPVALATYFELRKPWADWIACGQAGAAAARRAGDRLGEAWALNGLCTPYRGTGQPGDALECLRRSLRIRRQTGDRQAEGATLNNIGSIYGELGRLGEALDCFQQALDLATGVGDRFGAGIALQNLGEAYLLLRRYGDAARCLRQALRIARDNDDPQVEGLTQTNLGDACLELGEAATARGHYEQALAVRCRAGDRQGEAETRFKLGDLLHRDGSTARAREHWHRALAIFEELGDRRAADVHRRLTRDLDAAAARDT